MMKFLIVLVVIVGAVNVKGKGNDVDDKAQNSGKVIMQMEKLENQINAELLATTESLSQQAKILGSEKQQCYQLLLTPFLNTAKTVTKSINETIQSIKSGANHNLDPKKPGPSPKKGSSNGDPLNLLRSEIQNLNETRRNFENSVQKSCFKYK